MLWTLLTLVSSLSIVFSAVVTAKDAHASASGYALAIAIGLALGTCNAWAFERVAAASHRGSTRYSEILRERWLGALYVAGVAWALIASFFGAWVTSAAIQLIA